MAGKYPNPAEATAKFRSGVQLGSQKWVNNTVAGATDYQTWYSGFASVVYPICMSLPEKTGDLEQDVRARVTPVARAIKQLSGAYRREQVQKIVQQVQAVVR